MSITYTVTPPLTFARLVWLWEGSCPGTANARRWCGCGQPHQVYIFVRNALCAVPWHESGFFDGAPVGADGILAHFLDDLDLVEHGGSWYGAWLTPFGEDVLEVLRTMSDEEIEAAHGQLADSCVASPIWSCTQAPDCPNCRAYGPRPASPVKTP